MRFTRTAMSGDFTKCNGKTLRYLVLITEGLQDAGDRRLGPQDEVRVPWVRSLGVAVLYVREHVRLLHPGNQKPVDCNFRTSTFRFLQRISSYKTMNRRVF